MNEAIYQERKQCEQKEGKRENCGETETVYIYS